MIASLYRIITSIRNSLYDKGLIGSYQSALPVICIGNISAGGNGKTPVVKWLANELKKLGRRPVLLARGYGGCLTGPLMVGESHKAEEVGDEPLMFFRSNIATVVIARNRAQGARFIEQNKLGDLIVLDDGFQHRALKRNVDIVCAYVGDPRALNDFKAGRLLPWGRFREDKQKALGRAHAVIFNSRNLSPISPDDLANVAEDLPDSLPVYDTYLVSKGIYSESRGEYADFSDKDCVAFCALGNPQAFLDSLKNLRINIVESRLFNDHHLYSQQDIESLLLLAAGRPLICSEKDAIKINVRDYRDMYILKTELAINNKESLLRLIVSNI